MNGVECEASKRDERQKVGSGREAALVQKGARRQDTRLIKQDPGSRKEEEESELA